MSDQLLPGFALPPTFRPIDAHRGAAEDPARVRQMAQEFEAMLLTQMIRQMRQSMAFGEEGEEGGLGLDAMTDTIDVELARTLSRSGGIGIADVIVRSFEEKQALAAPAAPAALPAPARAPVTPAREREAPAVPVTSLPVREPSPAIVAHDASARPALPLPLETRTTSAFGWREDPFVGHPKFHKGIDLRAAYGTRVPAPAEGRVVFAGAQGGYGTTVVLEHVPGLQTRYAHLSSVDVAVGDAVAAGQVIGRVGTSGRSTAPHLHFELLHEGRPVDPGKAAERYAALAQFKSVGPDADSPFGRPSAAPTLEE